MAADLFARSGGDPVSAGVLVADRRAYGGEPATDYDTAETQNVADFGQLRDEGFEQVRSDHGPPPVLTPTPGPTSIGDPDHRLARHQRLGRHRPAVRYPPQDPAVS